MNVIPLVTFWLYRGGQVIGSVRAPLDATAQEVREQALFAHERNPTVGLAAGEAPLKSRHRLCGAEVCR